MGEWNEATISDVCLEIKSGGTPLTKISEYYVGGTIPWLKTKEVLNNRIDSTENYITEAGLKNSSAKLIPPNSIIVAMYGDGDTAGRVATNKIPLTTNQACCNLIINPDVAVSDFVFYALLGSYDQLVGLKTGSGQQNLNAKLIRDYRFPLPSIAEQKAIAEVLSSLDDKIDLLHRQNKTLESLAQTLFRQCFIEQADDSWEPGTLSDVSNNIRKSVSVAGISDEVKYVALEHIEKRHLALYSCGEGKTVASNKSEFQRNDILFGKLRPYFHKVCFAPFSGICSTDILVIRPKEEIFFPYCLFAYFQDEVVDYSDLASEGTRMPRTNWEILGNYPIVIPDRETLKRFNEVALPNIEKIEANVAQIASLTILRDALLPKLMSGEIQCQRHDIFVE